MTRTEIDELIKELEKNYHVKCEFERHEFQEYGKLIVTPNLPMAFNIGPFFNKDLLIKELDELEAIRQARLNQILGGRNEQDR